MSACGLARMSVYKNAFTAAARRAQVFWILSESGGLGYFPTHGGALVFGGEHSDHPAKML
jgi:hypothetical protein